ncbi:Uncharacterized protein FWK35_00015511 [Aphis craccivora]|uniref:OTU domain-containing protein n=1 Tax=Aphis craccivora TaxID=307492 RepID=A0A6G0YJC1_APHCR|nr:Uncharacterized protein FWK35_00015511 [Aphis craccivora]
MNKNNISVDTQHKIENTFKYYRQGSSVPSDGNCGLHAICKAIVEGVLMINKNTNVKSLMENIFHIFDLQKLPNYWWSDEELAVIANYFGYDMYIYNEADRTGIVFGKGLQPPLVLYSVDNNSHWIPGKKTLIPSSCIPTNFTIVENISEVLSIKQITIKIQGHLLMRTLNVEREYSESYTDRRNRSRSISSGRRVKSSNRIHNGSHSGVRDDGRSQSGRNKVSLNKRHEDSCSGGQYGSPGSEGRDRMQIARRDGSCPILEGGRGGINKGSYSGEEKINYSGKEVESHSREEKEENLSEKSDESLLVSCTLPVNDSHSCDRDKENLSLLSKSKNTMIRKMIKQFCHWDRKKKNKYNRLVLLDSEDKGDDFNDAQLDAIYDARYTILRDVLHHFASKNDRMQLLSEVSEPSTPPQPLEPSVVQFELDNSNPQLEPVEIECPFMVDFNSYSIEPVDSSSNTSSDCCLSTSADCYSDGSIACSSNAVVESYSNAFVDSYSNAIVDSYSNSAVNYPFIPSSCPLATPESPCDPTYCEYTSFEYTNDCQFANDNNFNDFSDGFALRQDNDIDGVYNQILPAPPAVGSIGVASAIAFSLMTASVVASPIMATEVVETLGLELLVMQEDPETAVTPEANPAMMVFPKMTLVTIAAPNVTTPTMVTPPVNDLVTILVDNDITTVPIKKNLAVASADNNPMVKPNKSGKRHFSFKKLWCKKKVTEN